MNLKVRSLNQDEVYCCAPMSVSKLFNKEEIDIYFGGGASRNENLNNQKYKPDKRCDDRILAYMVVHKSRINNLGLKMNSYLHVFILKSTGQEGDLCERFQAETLPYLFSLFLAHKNDDDLVNDGAFCVTVGLSNHKINIYEGKVRRIK